MAETFPFTLVTPTGIVYEGPVEQAVAIGALGEFGVLANHVNYITAIEPGMLTLYVSGSPPTEYLLSGGLAEVKDGAMTILALDAQPAAAVDSTVGAAAVPAAEEKLAGMSTYDPEYAEVEQELKLARARTAIEQLHRVHI
jgi:F-type H+-transporting ATPase subunit epsilon